MLEKMALMLVELVGLSVLVFAAVAWMKQLGARGKTLTICAFIFGLGVGLTYRYAAQPMVTFADWFLAVFFGLMVGFLATGAYKGGQGITGADKTPNEPKVQIVYRKPE
jgi:hypothetical protein